MPGVAVGPGALVSSKRSWRSRKEGWVCGAGSLGMSEMSCAPLEPCQMLAPSPALLSSSSPGAPASGAGIA